MTHIQSTHRCFWAKQATGKLDQRFDVLDQNLRTDVAIIGAGITGLSVALELLKSGVRVAVCEASVIGAGTTGRSTGHLDAHPEMGPAALVGKLGREKARAYVGLRLAAIDAIEQRCGGRSGFRRVPAYYYSESHSDSDQLQTECETALQIGLAANWQFQVPLRHAACGYRIDGMAQFDSLAYLHRLAQLVIDGGGQIFENTEVAPPTTAHPRSIEAGNGTVSFEHLVCAVHSNYTDVLRIDVQIPAYQSYVMAAQVGDPPSEALYWDNAEPYFYVRRVAPDSDLVLIGGCDHRTGTGDPVAALQSLEEYARRRFDVREVVCRWSAEFFEPVDGIPFIGQVPGKENVWIAAGFSGVGLTWGTAAGFLIADGIQGRPMTLRDEFSPNRISLSGLPTLAVEQIPGVASLAQRVLPAHDVDPELLKVGEGRVGNVDGLHTAVCRDQNGCEHRLQPICTHMGGVVRWNKLEQTWDCPVHGGRFAADGKRLYGPPGEDLEVIKVNQ